MSENNLPGVPGQLPATTRRGSLGLKRALQKLKFNPVKELIDVYPMLSPEEQAKVSLSLIAYLYPRFKPQEVRVKKSPKGVQNNIQINLPPGAAQKPEEPSIEDLVKVASTFTE